VLTHNDSVHLRYVLLLNGIAGLLPSMMLKGRENDPLLHSTWWTFDQHSAVLAVSAGAILASVLVYLAIARSSRRWWIFFSCGVFAGVFPATFYFVASPLRNHMTVVLTAMLVVGTVWGGLMGLIIYGVAGSAASSSSRPRRQSMVEIKRHRLMATHPLAAQPDR
jgi:hypothetical protein